MKDYRGALDDYKAALSLNEGLAEAQAGLKRCQAALGLPTTTTAAGGKKGGSSSSGGGGGGGKLTEEDAKMLEEAEGRVREVQRQRARAQQQSTMASSEKKRADLTLDQLGAVPDGRAVYRSVGRIFLRSPKEEIVTSLQAAAAKAEQKAKVCASTLEYLSNQEKEADRAFMEVVGELRRKATRA